MAEVVELGPHERMTVEECLDFCAREDRDFQDVMVIGVCPKGRLVVRSSAMDRKTAAWLLLEALDHARGIK